MKRCLPLLALVLLLQGCLAYVHNVYQDEVLPVAGTPITTTRERRIILGMNFDNDFVREARADFLAQCPGGTIHSVSTRLSSDNGFASWRQRVRLSGVCVGKS